MALAELPDGLDFASAIARLLLFSTWRLALLHRLLDSRDPVLAAVAGKGVKELAYHRDYAARWTLRLGDGTAESRPADAGRAGRGVALPRGAVPRLGRGAAAGRGRASPSTRRDPRAEVEGVLDEVIAAGHADPPDDPAVGSDRRPRRPAGPAHRAPGPPAGRDAVPGPRAPGGDMVSREGRAACRPGARPSAQRRRAGRRPRAADAHAGRPRAWCAASRSTGTRSP